MLLPGQLGELLQRHPSGVVQLYLGIQSQQQGEHIGEAEAAPQASTHGSQIAELHAHDVAQALLHGTLGQLIEAVVALHRAQRHHGP